MPSRVVALFIAFVLLWSGLSSIEAPRVLAQPSPGHQHILSHGSGSAAGQEGSVEHHHLDDLPSQAHNEPPTDTPGLLPVPSMRTAHSVAMAMPRAGTPREAGPPFLARALRPPCSATVAS
jgi:hypothetical protein